MYIPLWNKTVGSKMNQKKTTNFNQQLYEENDEIYNFKLQGKLMITVTTLV